MKARYYCEYCGVEVRPGAISCPSCGRVFTAVRCPECGFEGKASQFAHGCPSCGYMEKKKAEAPARASPAPRPKRTLSRGFYTVAGIVLAALVVALLVVLLVRP